MKKQKRKPTPKFGAFLRNVIDKEGLDVKAVAAGAEMNVSTVYRYFDGAPPPQGAAFAVMGSINRLAGREAVDVGKGMRLAGYIPAKTTIEDGFVTGGRQDEVVAKLVETVTGMPLKVQRDLLAIAGVLAARYKK